MDARGGIRSLERLARGLNSTAPTMEAYFAFETLAGGFSHLILLGLIMGGILGDIGGLIGKSLHWVKRVG